MADHSLKLRVLGAARNQPFAVRPDPVRTALLNAALVALAVAGMSLPLFIAGGPAHASGRPAQIGAWIVAGTALLAIAATAVALPPARSMLSRPRGYLLAVMIGVPLLVGLWIAFWHPSYADPFVRTGLRCFALTALTAPWPFAALVSLRRRPDFVQPMFTGGALGAAAGAWSAAMVELWCPLADAGHVAVGHVAPLVLLVLGGALAGRRLFAPPGVLRF